MVAKHLTLAQQSVKVVVLVPDDPKAFSTVRPDMRAMVTGNTVIMSPDNVRMYVTASTWEAMKDSYRLTHGGKLPTLPRVEQ